MAYFGKKLLTMGGLAAVGMLLLGGALAASGTTYAQQPPQPPHRFHGTVTLNGQPAPAGTQVSASVGGTVCATTTTDANAQYVLEVGQPNQPAACLGPGLTVTFTVAGVPAAQTATTVSGNIDALNLTAQAATPTPTPPPATPTPTPTPPPATPTPTPTPTVRPPVTGNAGISGDGSGSNLGLWLMAAGAGMLIVVGGAEVIRRRVTR